MTTEFTNQNSYRNYPFKEGAPLMDVTGQFKIAPGTIVDFIVYGLKPEMSYYVSATYWNNITQTVTFNFQDNLGNGFVQVALPLQNLQNEYQTSTFRSSDKSVAGRVVFNKTVASSVWHHTGILNNVYVPSSTPFELGVTVPEEAMVVSIYKPENIRLQNQVKLKEGYNVSLSFDEAHNAIKIDVGKGYGLGVICADKLICHRLTDVNQDGIDEVLCGNEHGLATINGDAVADKECGVHLTGDQCMRFELDRENSTITISNVCENLCDFDALYEYAMQLIAQIRAAEFASNAASVGNPLDREQWSNLPLIAGKNEVVQI